jgi:GntR family transcriptional regulator
MTGTLRPRPKLSFAVREDILARMDDGSLGPGTQLPPEPELAVSLGVSRATLREALRLLEDEGMITRTRGAGTFIAARPRVASNLADNFGVTDSILAAGMRPGFEEAEVRTEPVSGPEAERLRAEPGDDVVLIERVRTADDRPVVLSRDRLPASLLEGRPSARDSLARGSLYEVMERELGVAIHHGVARLRPMRAGDAVARRLRVPRGTLLLHLDQIDYDEGGRPVLSSHEYHLADAFEFTVVRRGPGRRLT